MVKTRRSLLFIPGNSPSMILNGSVFGADSVIFDLEDAVSPAEKDAARILVRNGIKTLDYNFLETIVRINSIQTTFWQKDLATVIPVNPDAILVPKVESAKDIHKVTNYLVNLEKESNRTKIIGLIETALGVENAYEIAQASERVTALFLGAEDLTADIGAKRTKEGQEIFYSRSRIIIAAKAAGIAAIDTPFTDVNDDQGLVADTILARDLGFDGKAVISPRHIDLVNEIFTPTEEEVEYAQKVMAVITRAQKEGKGAVALDGKMIDAPIVERAKRVLSLAEKLKGGRVR